MIKFLCKDMWTLVFKKQIDNLKTNHRVRLDALHERKSVLTIKRQGVYVLTDNTFRPLARMSMSSSSEAIVRAQPVGNDTTTLRTLLDLTRTIVSLVSLRRDQRSSW